ncbi:MAG: GspH/FimT family pseudopilin [Magnetococcales bacterium]|nr:GspH/FimT family pseudopilin [Magnetococcales bacterium]
MMKTNSGFTLIELMVVLSVLSILTTLAVPAFDSLIKDNRMMLRVNAFSGLANYARGEAVKRSARVTLCPSSDGAVCLTTGAWESGLIVFVDADDSATYNGGDTLLKVFEGIPGAGVTVRGSANLTDYISYIGTGLIRQVDGALQSGTLAFCDDRGAGDKGKTVTVNAIGRLVATTGVTTCVP